MIKTYNSKGNVLVPVVIGCVLFMFLMIPFFNWFAEGEDFSGMEMFWGFFPLLAGICLVVGGISFLKISNLQNEVANQRVPVENIDSPIITEKEFDQQKKQTRAALLVMSFLYLLSSPIIIMVSVMAFDAPGSTEDPVLYGLVIGNLLILVCSFVFGWVFYIKKRYKSAMITIFIPAILLAGFMMVMSVFNLIVII